MDVPLALGGLSHLEPQPLPPLPGAPELRGGGAHVPPGRFGPASACACHRIPTFPTLSEPKQRGVEVIGRGDVKAGMEPGRKGTPQGQS